MRAKLISQDRERTYAVIFDEGDEVASGLLQFAKQNKLGASHFSAIGGFRKVVLGYSEIDRQDYKKIPVDEQVEVLSLLGDIALEKGEPKIHAHVVIGMPDGSARGGHSWRVMSDLRWKWC